MTPPKETHFTNLVRGGSLPGASSGQIAARDLARAIIGLAPLLDGQACAGMMDFIGYVRKNPSSACDWFTGIIASYQTPHPVVCESCGHIGNDVQFAFSDADSDEGNWLCELCRKRIA